jgi:hypothetical protein
MDKYTKFKDRMEHKFPKIFKSPYGGFDVGEGWWPILESLCGYIQAHIDQREKSREYFAIHNKPLPDSIPQVVVTQIKEKFGGLRFYYNGGDECISGMVYMAEGWASRTCETCGSPGTLRGRSWLYTACDEHTKPEHL